MSASRTRRGALRATELSERVSQCLAAGSEQDAWRLLLQFVDDFRGSAITGKIFLTKEAPGLIGDSRYDAAIAALVEHLCSESDIPIPDWTGLPGRFFEPWWFPAGLPALEASALRDSPISFKRHGVFITARALFRV